MNIHGPPIFSRSRRRWLREWTSPRGAASGSAPSGPASSSLKLWTENSRIRRLANS